MPLHDGSYDAGQAGLVVIGDRLLTAAAATFDFQSIPDDYRHLWIIIQARGDTAASTIFANMTFNGDTSSIYDRQFHDGANATAAASADDVDPSIIVATMPAASATADMAGSMELVIPNYAGTVFHKQVIGHGGHMTGTATTTYSVRNLVGRWRSTAAINRVTITASAGNFIAGSSCTLLGVRF